MPEIDPEALLRRRTNALLAKWASGRRLTLEERAEIEPHLPRAAAPVPALVLEAQVEGVSEKTYQKRREAYAAQYGQSVRTINRWMREKAPLDDPVKMIDWWPTCHKHKVPDEVLAAARPAPISSPSDEAEKMNMAPVGDGHRPPLQLTSPLEQARALLNSAYAELVSAQGVAASDPARLARAQRAYKDASEQLRRVELADPKIRAAAGAVVDRETVRTALSRLHTSLASSLRAFLKRVRREMTGKEPAEQDAIWQSSCDKLFDRFRGCDFADPVS